MRTMHIRVDTTKGLVIRRSFRVTRSVHWKQLHKAWAKDVRVLDPNKHRFLISTCMDRDRRGKPKCLLSIFPGMYA